MKKSPFLLLIPFILLVALGVLYFSQEKFSKSTQELGCSCENVETATGDFDSKEKVAYFEGEKLSLFLADRPRLDYQVMGVSAEEKWIEINLTEQKLIAWEGDKKFLETPISSGKNWTPTPTGEYQIWVKLKYTKMSGGVSGTSSYYYLPNVPYVMFFYKSYGLHGTYWHSNFGQRMSHGCVNLPTSEAEKLFYWVGPELPQKKNSVFASKDNPGTRVIIHN